MSRKAIAVLLAVVLLATVFAVPAVASNTVKIQGVVVFSNIEGPHYELQVLRLAPKALSLRPSSYVLQGPFNFRRYLGRQVEVQGILAGDFSVWMKPVLRVERIVAVGGLPRRPLR